MRTREEGATMTITEPASLTNEQLPEVLKLIKGDDNVELKLSVPDVDRRSAVAALEMDALVAQIRQVVFFDTPDLKLKFTPTGYGRRLGGRAAAVPDGSRTL